MQQNGRLKPGLTGECAAVSADSQRSAAAAAAAAAAAGIIGGWVLLLTLLHRSRSQLQFASVCSCCPQ
jgi:hypothetical protein